MPLSSARPASAPGSTRITQTQGGSSANSPRGVSLAFGLLCQGRTTANGRGIGSGELTDEHWEPFYDAAWELARIGACCVLADTQVSYPAPRYRPVVAKVTA